MQRDIESDNYFETVKTVIFNQTSSSGLPNSIPSISGFIGREDYLNELRREYNGGKRCFVLHGVGGVGKTATALQFANEIADNYKAKVFVDMQGMSNKPLSAKDAMFAVIRQFESEIPTNISDAQLKNLFVQFVQNQPTLIVLDNAEDKESVESLKQAKACLITTSRQVFVLAGGKSLRIEQMSPEDARELLFELGGGEARFDGQADNIAYLASYLPMALKPLAALLSEDELETAAGLMERYRDKQNLFKEHVPDYNLTLEETLTVGASFELSYEKLSEEMKKRWRRLSVFPTDFDQRAIAAVLNISEDKAKETQRQLRRFSLLEVNAETKRFSLHDLIRAFTDAKLSADECFQAQFLFTGYYYSILWATDKIKSDDPPNGFITALKLIDIELSNIKFGQKWATENTKKDNAVAELCCLYSIFDLLTLRLHPREHINWQEASLTAVKQINDKVYEGNNSQNLGNAYSRLGDYKKAIEYHDKALRIARELQHKLGEGNSLGNLGNAYYNLGDYRKAIEYHEQSLQIKREIGDRRGEGNSLGSLGNAYDNLGDYRKAIEYHEQSLQISREIGNRRGEGNTLGNLGNAYFSLGEYRKVIEYNEQALQISREIGDRRGEGNSLGSLGSAYFRLGEYRKAIEYQEQSLQISREIGDRLGEGASLGNLGNAYFGLGDPKKACNLWGEAVTILEAIESPGADIIRQNIESYCTGE
ncbi:MAG TPA: tetratricopeptide repeat protein [Pyrinomonadaceae bacterium]|jgi:tetratricopeptide (TPR) repeat protein